MVERPRPSCTGGSHTDYLSYNLPLLSHSQGGTEPRHIRSRTASARHVRPITEAHGGRVVGKNRCETGVGRTAAEVSLAADIGGTSTSTATATQRYGSPERVLRLYLPSSNRTCCMYGSTIYLGNGASNAKSSRRVRAGAAQPARDQDRSRRGSRSVA